MVRIPETKTVSQPAAVYGFKGKGHMTLGYFHLNLQIGELLSPTKFYVINEATRDHIHPPYIFV